jgi:hypothetical protein
MHLFRIFIVSVTIIQVLTGNFNLNTQEIVELIVPTVDLD